MASDEIFGDELIVEELDPPVPLEGLENGEQFLEALSIRLSEIIRKPSGRFVISYVAGQPGSRRPPKIQ
jgi:hypothetical protein